MSIFVIFVPKSLVLEGLGYSGLEVDLGTIECGISSAIEKVRENTNYPEDWDDLEEMTADIFSGYGAVYEHYGEELCLYAVSEEQLSKMAYPRLSFAIEQKLLKDYFVNILDTYVISEARANSYHPEDWDDAYQEIRRVESYLKQVVKQIEQEAKHG